MKRSAGSSDTEIAEEILFSLNCIFGLPYPAENQKGMSSNWKCVAETSEMKPVSPPPIFPPRDCQPSVRGYDIFLEMSLILFLVSASARQRFRPRRPGTCCGPD